MKVTTKTGDSGWTDLLFGGRARKDSPRIEAVGKLDELNSLLGLLKCAYRRGEKYRMIESIQTDVYIISSEVVVLSGREKKLKLRVDRKRLARLEKVLAKAEKKVPEVGCCFIIPGGNRRSALLDYCRAVTRTVERRVLTLKRRGGLKNAIVPIYLNRLGDLLFLMARAEEKKARKFRP